MNGPSPRLDRLIERAIEVLPEDLLDRVVIFGSTPMVFAGIKAEANDLDLFVSEETFAALHAAGFAIDVEKPDIPRILLAKDIEVFKTWLGATFEEVMHHAHPKDGSRGLLVADLRHVLAGKVASNRPKDQPDIAALRRALSEDV